MSDITGNAAAAPALSTGDLQSLLAEGASAERFVGEIARMFGVQPLEVALLRLERNLLRFVCPEELKTSGTIPLSSSSSVAAHTASSKRIELFNNFTKIRHVRIFETVKLPDAESNERTQQPVIQKLISGPIQAPDGRVRGVIQICRKGLDLAGAGPDFSMEDVHRLEAVSRILAQAEFILAEGPQK